MLCLRQLAYLFLMLTFIPGTAQVVDRMAAVVNKRVIMESELDQAIRVELLLQGKAAPSHLNREVALPVLDQLIDRALLEQQVLPTDVLTPTPSDLTQRLQEARSQIPGAQTDAGWKALLEDFGLTQQDVEEQLLAEFRMLRFVDLRFRGLVRVDQPAIENYYQDKLLPELRRRNAPEPPLRDVSSRIERILAEQQVDSMLNDWLQTLRAQAHIEKRLGEPERPAPEPK